MKTEIENNKKDVIEILNSIPAKIFLKDKDGNMVLFNDEVAKACNLTIDKLIGTHDRDHLDEAQVKEFRKQELEIMSKGSQTFPSGRKVKRPTQVF